MGIEAIQYDCKSEVAPVPLNTNRTGYHLAEGSPTPCDPIMKPGVGAEQRGLENRPLWKTRDAAVGQENAVGDDDDAEAFVHQISDDLGQVTPQKGLPPDNATSLMGASRFTLRTRSRISDRVSDSALLTGARS